MLITRQLPMEVRCQEQFIVVPLFISNVGQATDLNRIPRIARPQRIPTVRRGAWMARLLSVYRGERHYLTGLCQPSGAPPRQPPLLTHVPSTLAGMCNPLRVPRLRHECVLVGRGLYDSRRRCRRLGRRPLLRRSPGGYRESGASVLQGLPYCGRHPDIPRPADQKTN
jgi:hypothetical protein